MSSRSRPRRFATICGACSGSCARILGSRRSWRLSASACSPLRRLGRRPTPPPDPTAPAQMTHAGHRQGRHLACKVHCDPSRRANVVQVADSDPTVGSPASPAGRNRGLASPVRVGAPNPQGVSSATTRNTATPPHTHGERRLKGPGIARASASRALSGSRRLERRRGRSSSRRRASHVDRAGAFGRCSEIVGACPGNRQRSRLSAVRRLRPTRSRTADRSRRPPESAAAARSETSARVLCRGMGSS